VNPLIVLALLSISGCASLRSNSVPVQGKKNYSYIDGSGQYLFSREVKLKKNKIIGRFLLKSTDGVQKTLEKSVAVSEVGSVKNKKGRSLSVRPLASEFMVWLDGKQYESRTQLDIKSKSLIMDLKSPEAKWQGRLRSDFPKGRIFCYFSQLPECLHRAGLLDLAISGPRKKINFHVIWDGFPFIQDQLTGVGSQLFSMGELKYEKKTSDVYRFLVEVDGQTILYQFSKSFELIRMFWIAQGISIILPGEQMSDLEN
jgi:hypothetical protein